MFEFLKHKKIPWYKSYKTSKWPVIVDITLIFIVLSLAIIFLSLYLFYPEKLNIKEPSDIDNNQEVKYEIDVNNLPLVVNYKLQENLIDRNNPQTKLELEIKNNSPVKINDIKIYFDNQSIKSDKVIEIEKLGPSEKISESVDLSFSQQDNIIKPDLNIEYNILDQTIKDKTNLPEVKFKASLDLSSMALYTANNGETLGLGPLPPVVGLPTNYWVFFEVDSIGDTKDFILSAKLPKNVEYYDEYSLLAGDLNYNEDNRQLIWKIDKLNEESGIYRLGVELQFIPSADQIGSLAPLVEDIVYYSTDVLSGEEISGVKNNIDTSLKRDKFNSGEGIIQE
ncbi:MAG: hypothetical protein PF488_03705 [Patescibacteria group bacterium]|jgi:hypothetical protein|nr:hypothetical protein [Patescibacteria group bacterium]